MIHRPPNPPAAAERAHAEARECPDFAQAHDPLEVEAARWVARKRNGLAPAQQAELTDWLGADPRHATAFAELDATFDRARALARAGGAAADRRSRRFAVGVGSRAAIAASFACVLLVGAWAGWAHWQRLPTFERSYTTARGQQMAVELPDGSALKLDTATSLRTHLHRDRREVHLAQGQALFNVRSDPARPFHVLAGSMRITVVGTRFSARHTPSGIGAGGVTVEVEEGRVRVARNDGSAQATEAALELSGGQAVTANGAGRLQPVITLLGGSVAAWQQGRLSFTATPLAEALAEFERYGDTGLVIRDPAVAAMPIGGSYNVREFQRFAEALPQVLPVRLERRGSAIEVVRRPP